MNRIPVVFLSLFLLAACSTTKKAGSPAPSGKGKATSSQEEEQHINTTYAFFNAVKEKLTGNEAKAAEGFADCLRNDPRNHAAMYELAELYAKNKKFNDALFFSKSAYDLSPANVWYAMQLSDIYQMLGKLPEAEKVDQKLVHDYPDHIDYYFSLAEVQLNQSKYQDAIKTFDQVESKIGLNRDLIIQKERIYLRLGKVDEAAKELEKLIKDNPMDMEAYSMLLEVYQVNNFPDKALEVIQRMKAVDADNPSVSLGLAEYYRGKGEKEQSFNELKKAFQSPQLGPEVEIRILMSYLPLVGNNPEMMEQALLLSKAMSEAHPNEANAQAVYGDFLLIDKKTEQARTQYRAALALDRKNMQAWQQLLITESDLQDFTAMEKESDEALSLYADQSIFYLFSGIAKAQLKKYEDAARALLSGSKLVVDNDIQLVEFYSNLGDTYNNLKNYPESDKYYDKALKVDANNVGVLNNYSYYLSLRNEQLDKAADMAKKANELQPNSASYEDTYAWVLYKQGNYNDAKTWLEKALQNGASNNGTILEHYGDVLYKLGRIQEAVDQWQKAKITGEPLPLIDKKINDRKLYE